MLHVQVIQHNGDVMQSPHLPQGRRYRFVVIIIKFLITKKKEKMHLKQDIHVPILCRSLHVDLQY